MRNKVLILLVFLLSSYLYPNTPPFVVNEPSDTAIDEDDSLIIGTSNIFSDTDGVIVNLTATSSDTNVIVTLYNNLLKAFPNSNWFGYSNITLTAVDDSGAQAECKFLLHVAPVNDPPVFTDSLSDTSIHHNDFLEINIWDHVNDVDNPDNSLYFRFLTNDDITFKKESSNVFIYANNFLGTSKIRVIVTDTGNLSDTAAFTFFVNNPVEYGKDFTLTGKKHAIDSLEGFTLLPFEYERFDYFRQRNDSLFAESYYLNCSKRLTNKFLLSDTGAIHRIDFTVLSNGPNTFLSTFQSDYNYHFYYFDSTYNVLSFRKYPFNQNHLIKNHKIINDTIFISYVFTERISDTVIYSRQYILLFDLDFNKLDSIALYEGPNSIFFQKFLKVNNGFIANWDEVVIDSFFCIASKFLKLSNTLEIQGPPQLLIDYVDYEYPNFPQNYITAVTFFEFDNEIVVTWDNHECIAKKAPDGFTVSGNHNHKYYWEKRDKNFNIVLEKQLVNDSSSHKTLHWLKNNDKYLIGWSKYEATPGGRSWQYNQKFDLDLKPLSNLSWFEAGQGNDTYWIKSFKLSGKYLLKEIWKTDQKMMGRIEQFPDDMVDTNFKPNNTSHKRSIGNINFYPYTIKGHLLNQKKGVVKIYHVNGKCIAECEIADDGKFIINTKSLLNGMYILSIQIPKDNFIYKFTKVK